MMELTKKDTKMIQGLSVLAMVWLHLFDTLDYARFFHPVLFLKGIPLVFYIAQLSDFCVMGFAFCSGYAHYKMCTEEQYYKKRIRSLLKLAIRYWAVLVSFTVISILVGNGGKMPGSLKTFIMHFLFLDSSYNGAWWYMLVYIVIILASPVLLKYIRKSPLWQTVLFGGIVYCLSYYYRFHFFVSDPLLSKVGPFGMTLTEYMMGAAAAKISFFTQVHNLWEKLSKTNRLLISIVLLIGLLLGRTLIVPSLFAAPVSGLILITLFHFWNKPQTVRKFFLFIGDHSTHIWLTHMFFYLNMFRGFAYRAVYPILIYVLMITISLIASALLNRIEKTAYSLTGL